MSESVSKRERGAEAGDQASSGRHIPRGTDEHAAEHATADTARRTDRGDREPSSKGDERRESDSDEANTTRETDDEN